jgi:hypothetical protein
MKKQLLNNEVEEAKGSRGVLLKGRFLYKCVLPREGQARPRVFPNLRRMYEYWNLLYEQLSFYFLTFFPVSCKK